MLKEIERWKAQLRKTRVGCYNVEAQAEQLQRMLSRYLFRGKVQGMYMHRVQCL